jgi:hypothetical protein
MSVEIEFEKGVDLNELEFKFLVAAYGEGGVPSRKEEVWIKDIKTIWLSKLEASKHESEIHTKLHGLMPASYCGGFYKFVDDCIEGLKQIGEPGFTEEKGKAIELLAESL